MKCLYYIYFFLNCLDSKMLDSLFDLAKSNPFLNPFQTARCSEGEQSSLARSSLVSTRNVMMPAVAGKDISICLRCSQVFILIYLYDFRGRFLRVRIRKIFGAMWFRRNNFLWSYAYSCSPVRFG